MFLSEFILYIHAKIPANTTGIHASTAENVPMKRRWVFCFQ